VLEYEQAVRLLEATVEYLPRDQLQPFHHRKQRWAIIVPRRPFV
jgi:hypothetical protein